MSAFLWRQHLRASIQPRSSICMTNKYGVSFLEYLSRPPNLHSYGLGRQSNLVSFESHHCTQKDLNVVSQRPTKLHGQKLHSSHRDDGHGHDAGSLALGEFAATTPSIRLA